MGTVVYAQPTKLDQVKGVLRLGDYKPPPQQKPLTDDDVYGNGPSGQGGPATSAAPQSLSDDDVYGSQPSLGQSAGYILHRGIDALATLPGAPADIAVGVGNLISRQFGGPQAADTGPIGSDAIHGMFHDASQAVGNAVGAGEALTYDAPGAARNSLERWGGNLATVLGSGGPGGLTKAGIKAALGQAVALSTAQEVAPDNPYVQMGAAAVGGFSPQLYTGAGQLMRGALRGGASSAADMRGTLAASDRIAQIAGQPIDVNPGQLAGGHNQMQVVDAALARSPGGQPGVMNANVSQQTGAARAVEEIARRPSSITPAQRQPNATMAGDAIRGGAEQFAEQFKARARQAEQGFEQRIGSQTRAPVTNTQRALTDLRLRAQSDPAIQRLIEDPYVRGVNEAVTNATSGIVTAAGTQIARGGVPTISYSALRALRSDVGELLGKASLAPSLREGQLKHLYAALTEDLTAAANQAGVGREWQRYNQWYASGMTRIEKTLQKAINGREQAPETIFNAVSRMGRRQAFQVMRSLSPEQRALVAGQMLREMGLSTAAGTVAEGAAYSYSTFIKNLEDMRQRGTLDAVFGAPEFRPVRSLLADLETTSESALRANKVAHDVSGAANMRGTAAMAVVAAGASGNIPVAVGIFALAWPTPALTGRLLRSRLFLRWLSNTKSVAPAQWGRHIAQLNAIANADPSLKEAIGRYQQGLTQALNQQADDPQQQQPTKPAGDPSKWTGSGGPLDERPNVPANYPIENQPNYGPHTLNGKPYDARDISRNVQGTPWPRNAASDQQRREDNARQAEALREIANGAPGFRAPGGDRNSPMEFTSRGPGDKSEIIPGQGVTATGQNITSLLKSMQSDFDAINSTVAETKAITADERKNRRQFASRAVQLREGNAMINDLEAAHVDAERTERYQRLQANIERLRKLIHGMLESHGPRPRDVPSVSAPRNV